MQVYATRILKIRLTSLFETQTTVSRLQGEETKTQEKREKEIARDALTHTFDSTGWYLLPAQQLPIEMTHPVRLVSLSLSSCLAASSPPPIPFLMSFLTVAAGRERVRDTLPVDLFPRRVHSRRD